MITVAVENKGGIRMSKKIKILFFMDGIGNAGGIQEMAIKWMENIDRSKYQIDILSYNTGKQDNYADRVAALGGKVYIIDTYMHKGKLLDSLKQTKQFFKEHPDYDILHAHSSSKAVFIMWYAKKNGIRIRILHSHCTKFVVSKKSSLLAANLLKKPTLMLTTHYYACSPEAGEFLFGKKAVAEGKVTIAHNGIDTQIFKPNEKLRNELREQLGIQNKLVIGNVGRFRPQKNHTYLMDIFAAVCKKNSDVILICIGNGELEDSIKEKAVKLGINSRIKFLGFRKDVSDLMQIFDVLVMPSLFEGLPVTGVEAQAIGVPAVFADTITKDAAILPQSSYVPLTATPDIWAEKILSYEILNHIDNVRDYIIERGYDIKIETEKLAQFYQQCVEN